MPEPELAMTDGKAEQGRGVGAHPRLRETARWSWAFVIFERPFTPRSLASS